MKRILDVIKKDECIQCKTLEEAEEYCRIAQSQGLTWRDGKLYVHHNSWCFGEYTVYYPHEGTYNSIFSKKNIANVISFEEFKKRLKEIEMEEMILEIPEGYEFVCIENRKIKLKHRLLPKTWEECRDILHKSGSYGYFVSDSGKISYHRFTDVTDLPTENLAKSVRALHKLLAAREVYRDGWKPDWNCNKIKYAISTRRGGLCKSDCINISYVLSFQSGEIRDAFYDNFKDLIEEAKELL